MSKEFENGHEKLTDDTRAQLKNLSRAILRLHKTLLDAPKIDFENQHGRITSVNHYFQLVLDDPHFAWLRKLSSLVALMDEAASIRRPATESEAQGLFNEAALILNFQDADEDFNDKFQTALQTNPDAVLNYNDALGHLK
jgi:GAF domain-containing protein